jgi:hypothetical protein
MLTALVSFNISSVLTLVAFNGNFIATITPGTPGYFSFVVSSFPEIPRCLTLRRDVLEPLALNPQFGKNARHSKFLPVA